MFGNTKGWGISGLIVVVVGLLIFFMGRPPSITPPTGSLPLALVSASLQVGPETLGIKPSGTDADAHDLYVKVIDDYKKNQFKYEQYSDVTKLEKEKKKPPFLQWIVEAADCSKATLFVLRPEAIINYANRQDSLEALKTTGNWASSYGLLLVTRKNYDAADPYLKGAFILGQRLYEERLRWDEYTAGTALMSSAVYGMAQEARAKHDDARAAQLDAFQEGIKGMDHRLVDTWAVVSSVGTDGNTPSDPGDMFDIAKNSKETMWRVEATLKLGRIRFMGNATGADQVGAVRVLKDMADNADVLPVRTAAAKARDLTREDFRMIGGGS